MKYARVSPAGDVTVETVETQGLVEVGATSIQVDPSGGVHLGYYANGDGHYGYRAPTGTWTSGRAMEDGRQTSLALAGHVPHMVASSNPSIGVQASLLSYGHLNGSTPAPQSFVRGPDVHSYVGLSLPYAATLAIANGVPLVAWVHPDFQDLRLSKFDAGRGSWSSTTVDSNAMVGSTSLRVFEGKPRIAYVAFTNATGSFYPTYAEPTATGYRTTLIDRKPITVGTLSLAIDSSGRPHVTLYDPDPSVQGVFYVH